MKATETFMSAIALLAGGAAFGVVLAQLIEPPLVMCAGISIMLVLFLIMARITGPYRENGNVQRSQNGSEK